MDGLITSGIPPNFVFTLRWRVPSQILSSFPGPTINYELLQPQNPSISAPHFFLFERVAPLISAYLRGPSRGRAWSDCFRRETSSEKHFNWSLRVSGGFMLSSYFVVPPLFSLFVRFHLLCSMVKWNYPFNNIHIYFDVVGVRLLIGTTCLSRNRPSTFPDLFVGSPDRISNPCCRIKGTIKVTVICWL